MKLNRFILILPELCMAVIGEENTVNVVKNCAYCKGEGCIGVINCPACDGRGQLLVRSPPTRCAFCGGFGVAGCCRCSMCEGTGWSGAMKRET
jgi:hypothetical protein